MGHVAALDEDAAAVIHEGLSEFMDDPDPLSWRTTLISTLLEALDHHPLARRVLSGLEPGVSIAVNGAGFLTDGDLVRVASTPAAVSAVSPDGLIQKTPVARVAVASVAINSGAFE
jgi:hypothetical protein